MFNGLHHSKKATVFMSLFKMHVCVTSTLWSTKKGAGDETDNDSHYYARDLTFNSCHTRLWHAVPFVLVVSNSHNYTFNRSNQYFVQKRMDDMEYKRRKK